MKIQIVSDPVCPWCYIGKRRLDRALASRPEISAEISWLPYQLAPDLPREGRDRVEHYRSLFGEARARLIIEQMRETAREEGLEFQLKPGARSPNTLSAHVLMLLASEDQGVDSSRLADLLFSAHHERCEDLGDPAVLVRLGAEAGLDAAGLAGRIADPEAEQRVRELIGAAAAAGVSGVPFFIFEGRWAVSGAQPAEALAQLLDRLAAGDGAPHAAQ